MPEDAAVPSDTAVPSVSRRGFLAAPLLLAAGPTLAACSDTPPPVAVDPERERLEVALDLESQLLIAATAWAAQVPNRSQVTTAFAAHVDRLTQTLAGATPSATTSPAPSSSDATTPPSTDELVALVRRAVRSHSRATREADPRVAQLLASIAASDQAVLQFLGQLP